jgi:hypothetical protein
MRVGVAGVEDANRLVPVSSRLVPVDCGGI